MALAIFFIITWAVILSFFLLPERLSFIENAFIFFIMSTTIKNSFTIVGLNLKWIEGNMEPAYFLGYLLYRTIIYPGALLVMTNIFYTSTKSLRKSSIVVSMIILLFLVEELGETLNLYTYKTWNHLFSITEIILFTIISLGTSNLIMSIHRRKSVNEGL